MRLNSIALGAFFVLFAGAISLTLLIKAPSDESLPVLGKVPSFSLLSSDNQEFSSESLRGKIWVASFFFTSCEATCPTLMGELAKISRSHAEQPQFKIVSVTVDPQVDTPEVLSTYAQRFSANAATWELLTGPKDKIEQLVFEGFRAGSANEPLLHTNRFYLVDTESRIRGTYLGTDPEGVRDLERDLALLLQ